MSDNDLIRRGDALEAAWEADSLELSTHGAKKIEARINTIPAVQPTVKPLVWRSNGKGRVCADTPFGLYEVEHGRYGMRLLHGGSFMQDDLQGIEAAKAAAQADYEARILSVLDMQPTVSPKQLAAQPDDVAALVDVIRVQTGLIRGGCGGAQNRLNICCDRIDATLARVKGETK